jgi:hypothetical protein
VRFLLDENLSPLVRDRLEAAGHDAVPGRKASQVAALIEASSAALLIHRQDTRGLRASSRRSVLAERRNL